MKKLLLILALMFVATDVAAQTQRIPKVVVTSSASDALVVNGGVMISGNVTMPSFTVQLNQDAATGVSIANNFNTANAQAYIGLGSLAANAYLSLMAPNFSGYGAGHLRVTGANSGFDLESDSNNGLGFYAGGYDAGHKQGGINSNGFYLGSGVTSANIKVFKRYTIAGQLQEQLYNDSDSPLAYAEYAIKSGTTQATTVYFGAEGGLSNDAMSGGRGYLISNPTGTTQPGFDIFACSATTPANCTLRIITNGFTTPKVRATFDSLGMLIGNSGALRVDTGFTTSGSQDLLSFATGQLSGTEKFRLTFGVSANAGDGTRGDAAAAFGWNVSGDGGAPAVANEPAIMWRFENYYRPGSTGCNTSTHGCQEAHLQWILSDGTVYRPLGWQGIDNTKTSSFNLSGDISFLSSDSNTQNVKFNTGGTVQFLSSGAVMLKDPNNSAWIKQINAAGNHYNALVYTDTTDKVVIGDSTPSTGTNGVYFQAGQSLFVRAFQTTAPTCTTNCGTSPSVVGSNFEGRITMGGTGSPASGFVVTFNGTWPATPHCNVWMSKTGMLATKMPIVMATDTNTLTVTTNGAAPANSDTYDYRCTSN